MTDATNAQIPPPRRNPPRTIVPRGNLSPTVLVSRLGELASKTKPHKAAASRSVGSSVLGRGGELALSPRGVVPSYSQSAAAASSTLLPSFEPSFQEKDPILPVLNDLNLSEHKPIATVYLGKSKSKRLRVSNPSTARGHSLPPLLEADGDAGNDYGSLSPPNRGSLAASERLARLQACFTMTARESFEAAQWLRHRQTGEPLYNRHVNLRYEHLIGQKSKAGNKAVVVHGLTESKSLMTQLELTPSAENEAQTSRPADGTANIPGHESVEEPEIPRQSDQDETILALEAINMYRHLAGLRPVGLDDKCMQACDVLLEVFREREPIMRPPGHPQQRVFHSLSEKLSTLLGRNQQHFAVLQGEATLTGMVQQGLHACICVNGVHDVDNRKIPRPPNEHLTRKVRELAAQPAAKIQGDGRRKHGRIVAQLDDEFDARAAMQPPVLDPEGLDLGVLWGLATELEPACSYDRSSSRASTNCSRRTRGARRRAAAATDVARDGGFWGDPSGALGFRRLVLDPTLEWVGMSRINDICVIWTLPALDAISAIEQNIPLSTGVETSQTSEVICFPPPGTMPMELFIDASTPWSIMPCSKRFQPTAAVKVRMWRVQINKPAEDASPNSRQRCWSADRIEEVPIARSAIDCSARGNSFCFIFWPRPPCGICGGDQYEVVLSGLTGTQTELRFFHEFVATGREEHALLAEAKQLFHGRLSLGDSILWQTPTFFDHTVKLKVPHRMSLRLMPPEDQQERLAEMQRNSKDSPKSSPGRGSMCRFRETSAIKPVSHPSKQLEIDFPQLALAFESTDIIALSAHLNFCRLDGSMMEIPRSTMVHRIGSRFIVLLRFPFLAGAWYELSFKTATEGAPTFEDDTLRYLLHAPEKVPSIVPSFNHPLMDKFGFPYVNPLNTQSCGALVLAPRTFRIYEGTTYFLLYLDRTVPVNGGESKEEIQPQILRRLLESDPKPQPPDGSVDGLAQIHCAAAQGLRSQVQVTAMAAHAELSINGGQFVKPLWPRGDYPCLYEGFLELGMEHLHKKVELFLRYPQSDTEWSPLKQAEWKVVKSEHFPQGF